MKRFILVLLAALMGLSLMPVTAEAASRHSRRDLSRSRHHHDHDRHYRGHDRHRHHRHYRRVTHPGHWTWRNHHRIWVPARTIVIAL